MKKITRKTAEVSNKFRYKKKKKQVDNRWCCNDELTPPYLMDCTIAPPTIRARGETTMSQPRPSANDGKLYLPSYLS